MRQAHRSSCPVHRSPAFLPLAVLAILAQGLEADAGEGVIEINQTIALAGNVTAGDAPGFPVTISAPGSYRLTSNLVLPFGSATNIAVLSISAADVTIDLNGFTIRGIAACSGGGATVSCTDTGTGAGIVSTIARTSIHSGFVRSMSGRGIELAGGRVWNVQVEGNGGVGIWSNSPISIEDSLIQRNFGDGVAIGPSSSVSNVISTSNLQDGFDIGDGSIVLDSVSSQNGLAGFRAGGGSVVANCVARSNVQVGITGSGAAYRACVLTFNNGSNANPQSSSAAPIADNYCGGDTICP